MVERFRPIDGCMVEVDEKGIPLDPTWAKHLASKTPRELRALRHEERTENFLASAEKLFHRLRAMKQYWEDPVGVRRDIDELEKMVRMGVADRLGDSSIPEGRTYSEVRGRFGVVNDKNLIIYSLGVYDNELNFLNKVSKYRVYKDRCARLGIRLK